MIIQTGKGRTVDTETDLSPAERHILQKLFLWEGMVNSKEEFEARKTEALSRGWNDSGPVSVSEALGEILRDMEARVAERITAEDSSHKKSASP